MRGRGRYVDITPLPLLCTWHITCPMSHVYGVCTCGDCVKMCRYESCQYGASQGGYRGELMG